MRMHGSTRFIGLLVMMLLGGSMAGWVTAPAAAQGDSSGRPGGLPAGVDEATVTGHVDGNTILVIIDGDEEEVDLIGLDAPRLSECFGQEARARLVDLLPEDSTVYLERGERDRHRDGALLRFVWYADDRDEAVLVNTKMIREGYAGYRTGGKNDKYDERMEEQAEAAEDANRGLWGVCGDVHVEALPTPTPTPSVEQIKAQYAPLADVRELAIRPGGMIGQKISFYGTVRTINVARPGYVFVLGDSEERDFEVQMQVDVAAPDGTTEYVFVGFNGDTAGMFEGSYVLVYGTVIDTQTFQNALGGTVTQPLVDAQFVELQ